MFPFSTEVCVRIGDINAMNHLSYDAVVQIMAEGRVKFLQQYDYRDDDIEGAGLLMTDLAIVYKAEAFYGDMLIVEVGASDFTARGCDFIFRLTNKKTKMEIALGKNGFVFFDYEQRKPVTVPEKFKSLFAP